MGKSSNLWRGARAAPAALLLLCAPLPLGGCASASSFAGIPLAAGAADPDLQSLARRARVGDEQAQLELGIRYEEGRGVAVDRMRAVDLYFDAATRPSRDRIAIYVPTPGGAVPSFVRTFPTGLDYSGNEEALRRWNRLLAGPRKPGAPPKPALPLHGDHPEAGRVAAVNLYAYHPLFLGLVGAEPWQAAIARPTGYAFFTARAVDDALLMILDRSGPTKPGERPDGDAVRRLCGNALAGSAPWTRAQVRLFVLCLARSAGSDREAIRERIRRSQAALASDPGGAAGAFPHGTMDRILLFRAGQHCACGGDLDFLLEHAAADILAHSSPDGPRAGDYVQTWASLILARLESPNAPVWLNATVQRALSLAARGLESRFSPFAHQNVDEAMVSTCAELGLDYDECRRTYYAGPLLFPKVSLILSGFIAAEAPAAVRCAGLRRDVGEVAGELRFQPDVAAMMSRFLAQECGSSMPL